MQRSRLLILRHVDPASRFPSGGGRPYDQADVVESVVSLDMTLELGYYEPLATWHELYTAVEVAFRRMNPNQVVLDISSTIL